MNAYNKEKVFEELRSYHLEQFPEKIKNDKMNEVRLEFGLLEDSIIAMILGLIDGRKEFNDFSQELDSIQDKLKRTPPQGAQDDKIEKLFAHKIGLLTGILTLTKKFDFKLKPVRLPKVAVAKA